MAVEDLGPMRLSAEPPSSEPRMPEIPIKPNTAIPVVVGLFLILGGILLAYSAYSNLFGGQDDASSQAADTAATINEAGGNLTEQEVKDYFAALDDAGYYTTLGIIESIAAVLLLYGGALLMRCMRKGVRIALAGGALVAVDAIIGLLILNGVESPDPLLSITLKVLGAICIVVGLLCTALPLIPMLITSGKAALLPALEPSEDE